MWLVNRRKGQKFYPSRRFARHSQAVRFAHKYHSKGFSVRLGRISRRSWKI